MPALRAPHRVSFPEANLRLVWVAPGEILGAKRRGGACTYLAQVQTSVLWIILQGFLV